MVNSLVIVLYSALSIFEIQKNIEREVVEKEINIITVI